MKQTSKLLGLLSLMLIASPAKAQWQGNILLGLEGGYAWRNGNLNTVINNYADVGGARTLVTSVEDQKSLDNQAGFYGLVLGYQAICHKILFGLEANINWHGSDHPHNFHQLSVPLGAVPAHHAGAASFERGTTVGLSMRMGYQSFKWLMPYLRIGVQTSNDTLTYSSQLLTSGITTLPVTVYAQDHQRNYNFVGGLGLEVGTVLNELTVRLEYNYVPNSKRSKVSNTSVDTPPLTVASPVEEHFADTKQNQHLVKAALVWNFD